MVVYEQAIANYLINTGKPYRKNQRPINFINPPETNEANDSGDKNAKSRKNYF
jgi:hypothetical protein